MNKLIAIAAGLFLATTVLAANAAQPRQKSQQEQQARANIEQNNRGAEQASNWKHRHDDFYRDRDEFSHWDEGYWDNGKWYPKRRHHHHRRHHHNSGPGLVVEFPSRGY